MHPATSIVANLLAKEPAAGQDGKVIGFPAAQAILAAIERGGFRIVSMDDLKEIEKHARAIIASGE